MIVILELLWVSPRVRFHVYPRLAHTHTPRVPRASWNVDLLSLLSVTLPDLLRYCLIAFVIEIRSSVKRVLLTYSANCQIVTLYPVPPADLHAFFTEHRFGTELVSVILYRF